MLSVRPPGQAARSWKDFLIQIATVAVGLLIALSLQAGAEWLHWRGEVARGRERLRQEILFDEQVYVHRVDVASCVEANLTVLKRIVADLQAKKRVEAVTDYPSPQNGPIRREVWSSLNAAQIAVHFPPDELEKYNQFYANITDAEYFMDRESRDWAQIHLLQGEVNGLSPQEINTLRIALRDAEEMGSVVTKISKRQIDAGRSLGIEPPQEDAKWRVECH